MGLRARPARFRSCQGPGGAARWQKGRLHSRASCHRYTCHRKHPRWPQPECTWSKDCRDRIARRSRCGYWTRGMMPVTARPSLWQATAEGRRRVRMSGARAAVAATNKLFIIRDPLRISLFVLTVLTISRVHEHYSILAKLRPGQLLVVASVGYAYLNPRFLTRVNVFRFWPTRLVLALAIL